MTSTTSQAMPMEDPCLGHLLYGLMTGFPLLLLPVLLSLTINFSQRSASTSQLLSAHLRWQKISIMGLLIMLGVAYFLPQAWLGLSIAAGAFAWFALRIIKGWLLLADGRTI